MLQTEPVVKKRSSFTVAGVTYEATLPQVTHRGPESELGAAYDMLYGAWMKENGRRPAGFDFEVWDERYQPEEPYNEIDLYVALAGDELRITSH